MPVFECYFILSYLRGAIKNTIGMIKIRGFSLQKFLLFKIVIRSP